MIEEPIQQPEEEQAPVVPEPQSAEVVAMSETDLKAQKIVKDHVLCSIGAGLIPIPLVDIASVTAIQVDALNKLAELYGIDASEGNLKAIATGLAGSTAARIAASAVKLVPGIGTLAGGATMAGLSGASTYAVCQVAQNHFKTKGTFLDFNMTDAKEAYAVALDKGKEMAKTLEVKKDEAIAKFEEMQKQMEEKIDIGAGPQEPQEPVAKTEEPEPRSDNDQTPPV